MIKYNFIKKTTHLFCVIACFVCFVAKAQNPNHAGNLAKIQSLLDRNEAERSSNSALLDSLKTLSAKLNEDLVDLEKATTKSGRTEAKMVENELKTLSKQQKIATKNLKEIGNQKKEYQKLRLLKPTELQTALNKIEAKESIPIPLNTNEQQSEIAAVPAPQNYATVVKTSKEEIKEKKPKKIKEKTKEKEKTKKETPKKESSKTAVVKNTQNNYLKYDVAKDPAMNPPLLPCEVVFSGRDSFSGKARFELAEFPLFAQTDDFLRATMKDKDFITCVGQWSRAEGFRYLSLTFIIQSRDAQRSFGILDKSSPVSFKLMNGRNVNLLNIKTDLGVVDTEKGITTYRAKYTVRESDARDLANSEVDVLRVAWSTGYEDYEIYAVDVLQQQLKCLEK